MPTSSSSFYGENQSPAQTRSGDQIYLDTVAARDAAQHSASAALASQASTSESETRTLAAASRADGDAATAVERAAAALASQNAAAGSAQSAADFASTAASQATTAVTQAGIAITRAGEASTSAAAALASQNAAQTSAQAAATFTPTLYARLDGSAFTGGVSVAGSLTTGGKAVWHTGNLDPALYAPLTGAAFTGDVTTAGALASQATGDAKLILYTTGVPSTSYSHKQIFSSPNVDGGNSWLFRATRMSDGNSRDTILNSSGTILTTGNFDTSPKLNTTAPEATGDLILHGVSGGNWGGVRFISGNGTSEDWGVSPTGPDSGRGLAIRYQVAPVATFNTDGSTAFAGPVTISGQTAWHAGNFDPSSRLAPGDNRNWYAQNGPVLTLQSHNTGIGSNGSNFGALCIKSADDNQSDGAAFMSFWRKNYAAYIGIDTDNSWRVGGWSMGSNSYRIWHEQLGYPITGIRLSPAGSLSANDVKNSANGDLFEPYAGSVITGLAGYTDTVFWAAKWRYLQYQRMTDGNWYTVGYV